MKGSTKNQLESIGGKLNNLYDKMNMVGTFVHVLADLSYDFQGDGSRVELGVLFMDIEKKITGLADELGCASNEFNTILLE